MGQTLTHGIYLPDEGERNCYDGLASNWSILDGAVGTVAEHTSQIAGKAPAVHTHTKSDVTDLLNSNFIPSANNTYDLGSSSYQWNRVYCNSIYSLAVINSNNAASPSDSSVSSIIALRNIMTYTSGDPDVVARINFRLMGNGDKSIYPHESNQYSLGLASRAWSNSYIQHGYFNGIQQGDEYSNNVRTNLTLSANRDTPSVSGILVDSLRSNTTQGQAHHILGFEIKENSVRYSGCRMHWAYDSNVNKYNFALCPTKQGTNQPASFGLGETGYYWDTINGINPGALSIPDGADSGANSSFTPDTTDWPKDGTAFQATMPIVGWLRITIKNVAGNYAFVRRGTAGANLPWQIFADPSFATDFAEVTLNVPVTNATYTLRINSPGGFTAKVYPCLGNV